MANQQQRQHGNLDTPTTAPSKRKHVTTACVNCRESKVKCNGEVPTCSSCARKGRLCRYTAGDDRRKISLRLAVELLVSRVSQLSGFIGQHELQIPPMPDEDGKVLSSTLESLGIPLPESGPTILPGPGNSHMGGAVEDSLSQPTHHVQRAGVLSQYDDILAVETDPPDPQVLDADFLKNVAGDTIDVNSRAWEAGPAINTQEADKQDTDPFQIRPSTEAIPQENHATTSPQNTRVDETGNTEPFRLVSDDQWAWEPYSEASSTSPPEIRRNSHVVDGVHCDSSKGDLTLSTTVDENEQAIDDDLSSTSSNMDDLVNQLSDRVGTLQIGPEGHFRFYGSTSNLNLLTAAGDDHPHPTLADTLRGTGAGLLRRNTREDGPEHLERMGVGTRGKGIPAELEEQLVELYFQWQDSSFHVVDREMYESAKERWWGTATAPGEDTGYYSETLRNAICAIGAAFLTRHHPTFITYPRTLGDFFADRCKALMDIELDDTPCVATIQALIVLSTHEVGQGRDARGWLHSGMALRLAFTLALHVDLSRHVALGQVTAHEAEVRRTVFWGAFVVDHGWCFYLGQPSRFPVNDITLVKPGQDVGSGGDAGINISTTSVSIVDRVSRLKVWLCEIMTPLGHDLYGSRSMSRHELQQRNVKVVRALLAWKRGLPEELQVDLNEDDRCNQEPRETNASAQAAKADVSGASLRATQFRTIPPEVLMLHLQYHQSMIYAHRPWMSRSYLQPLHPPQGPGAGHARYMCKEAGVAIAKLLGMWERRFPLRNMSVQGVAVAFSAATLLMFACTVGSSMGAHHSNHHTQWQEHGNGNKEKTGDHEKNDLMLQLNVCLRALDDLSASWPNGERARGILSRLQRHWQIRSKINKSQTHGIGRRPVSSSGGNRGTGEGARQKSGGGMRRGYSVSSISPRLSTGPSGMLVPRKRDFADASAAREGRKGFSKTDSLEISESRRPAEKSAAPEFGEKESNAGNAAPDLTMALESAEKATDQAQDLSTGPLDELTSDPVADSLMDFDFDWMMLTNLDNTTTGG